MIISLITLSGGTLAQPKLDRYLQRLNAEMHMLPNEGGGTEAVLQRMIKQGYLTRTREVVGGDETIEWGVGARGRVEVGKEGVEGLVKAVYGLSSRNEGDDEGEQETEESREITERLGRSLGLVETTANSQRKRQQQQANGEDGGEASGSGEVREQENGGGKRRRGRPRRTEVEQDGDDEAEYAY